MCDGLDLFLCLLAVLFPPVAVWVKRGICSADSIINIALCCLGYLPGLLHAWYIISSYPDPSYEPIQNEEHIVYYVHAAPAGGYGTVTPHGQFPGQHSGTANAFTNQQPGKAPKMTPAPPANSYAATSSSSAPAPAPGAEEAAAHSVNPDAPPPTYADAVKGDYKVQHD
ncbi:hypothetical protein, variant [Verruconis gallopava]|uniref:Plasma membrane proteolipid 3 n=1 Tax=Verruconis gallopava TaxID=253628 RepID=A0A0D2A4Y3_9PEZI|nr:uncharacterized protein PV09_06688 [Verruconis gallopava]XP_016211707.1 hypothetical protein, variant [Verruconis gallopava]KIW01837.1 hypothetical protein PV09_06688 [Verruconis gallopava]KIW01838.1 hypothetical protein, variant [Verruconis gallopava]